MPYKINTSQGLALIHIRKWQTASDIYDLMEELQGRGEKDAKKALAALWDMAVVKQASCRTRNDGIFKARNALCLPVLSYQSLTITDEEHKAYAAFFSEKYMSVFEEVLRHWNTIKSTAAQMNIDIATNVWLDAQHFAHEIPRSTIQKVSGSDFIGQEVFTVFDQKANVFLNQNRWTSLLSYAQVFPTERAAEQALFDNHVAKSADLIILPLSLSVAPSQTPTKSVILDEAQILASRNALLQETLKGNVGDDLANRAAPLKKM